MSTVQHTSRVKVFRESDFTDSDFGESDFMELAFVESAFAESDLAKSDYAMSGLIRKLDFAESELKESNFFESPSILCNYQITNFCTVMFKQKITITGCTVHTVGWSDFFYQKETGTRQVVPNCLRNPNPKLFFFMLLFNWRKSSEKCCL